MLELTDLNTVGIDEAGRGCLAKEVCTAGVVFPISFLENLSENEKRIVNDIKDSKKLSEEKRNIYSDFIKSKAYSYAITTSSSYEIDEKNILNATINSMHRTLDIITNKCKIDKIIIDGNQFRNYKNINHVCLKNADNLFLCVASASILAKVHRDNLIYDYCKRNPDIDKKYGFSRNKTYGTKQHINAIHQFGVLSIHRKSFSPIRNVYSFL